VKYVICRGGWPGALKGRTDHARLAIAKDLFNQTCDLSKQTYYDYISGFEKLMIIEDIEAWCPAIRSKTSIRSSKKRNFVDHSIGAAALGLSPEYFSSDYKTLGFLFESLCIRDLKIYICKWWNDFILS